LYQGAVHLRVADAMLVDGDVIAAVGVEIGDPPLPPAAAELSAAADMNRTAVGAERRVRAAVDIQLRVRRPSFPMRPRNRCTIHESGGRPFCNI